MSSPAPPPLWHAAAAHAARLAVARPGQGTYRLPRYTSLTPPRWLAHLSKVCFGRCCVNASLVLRANRHKVRLLDATGAVSTTHIHLDWKVRFCPATSECSEVLAFPLDMHEG